MAKCLVIYSSKYGSTGEVARAVAEGLGAETVDAADSPDLAPYDVIVFGSPIYAGDYLQSVMNVIRANRELLAERKTAAFITAAADVEIDPGLTGDEDELRHTQQDYADGLAEMAGGQVLGTRGFGGRLNPDQLDESDRKMLSWFYRFLMRDELKGFDLIDLSAAKAWGEELKAKLAD
jgi:menaquinone-dependent protoporphyrinogen IX oxidase